MYWIFEGIHHKPPNISDFYRYQSTRQDAKTTKSCPLTVLDGIAEVSDDGRRRRKNACEADNETLKESGSTPMASSDSGVESAAEVDLTEMKVRTFSERSHTT
ncbi:hypothetical protein ANCCAN_24529 [Ancylostoma caninum]|uniref:Uncharacterized protein n=1 Tax=Ancylostoma caninum TaxID=29170 RepID=A0A368FCA8_ANCCA|nr:hypothetical protein ANCCAN_24529 [Ancylostoma caninum]